MSGWARPARGNPAPHRSTRTPHHFARHHGRRSGQGPGARQHTAQVVNDAIRTTTHAVVDHAVQVATFGHANAASIGYGDPNAAARAANQVRADEEALARAQLERQEAYLRRQQEVAAEVKRQDAAEAEARRAMEEKVAAAAAAAPPPIVEPTPPPPGYDEPAPSYAVAAPAAVGPVSQELPSTHVLRDPGAGAPAVSDEVLIVGSAVVIGIALVAMGRGGTAPVERGLLDPIF
jgi:hypothetical protein